MIGTRGARHVREGTPAGDQRRALVGRWDALGARFHPAGADGEATRAAAREAWRDRGEEFARALPWPAEDLRELLAYVDRAREAG